VLRLWSAYIPCITKVSDDSYDVVFRQKRRSKTSQLETDYEAFVSFKSPPVCSAVPVHQSFGRSVSLSDNIRSQLKPTTPIAWLKH